VRKGRGGLQHYTLEQAPIPRQEEREKRKTSRPTEKRRERKRRQSSEKKPAVKFSLMGRKELGEGASSYREKGALEMVSHPANYRET